jgi:hypothetical protein
VPANDEKFVNTHWCIGITGRDEELLVYAAYPDYHHGATFASATTVTWANEPTRVSLWTADGRLAFQAPVASVAYMRRADATGKIDRNATPLQVRDLQAELEEPGLLAPVKPAPADPLLLGEVRPGPRRRQHPAGGAV